MTEKTTHIRVKQTTYAEIIRLKGLIELETGLQTNADAVISKAVEKTKEDLEKKIKQKNFKFENW